MSKIAWFREYNNQEEILYVNLILYANQLKRYYYLLQGGDLDRKSSEKLRKVN